MQRHLVEVYSASRQIETEDSEECGHEVHIDIDCDTSFFDIDAEREFAARDRTAFRFGAECFGGNARHRGIVAVLRILLFRAEDARKALELNLAESETACIDIECVVDCRADLFGGEFVDTAVRLQSRRTEIVDGQERLGHQFTDGDIEGYIAIKDARDTVHDDCAEVDIRGEVDVYRDGTIREVECDVRHNKLVFAVFRDFVSAVVEVVTSAVVVAGDFFKRTEHCGALEESAEQVDYPCDEGIVVAVVSLGEARGGYREAYRSAEADGGKADFARFDVVRFRIRNVVLTAERFLVVFFNVLVRAVFSGHISAVRKFCVALSLKVVFGDFYVVAFDLIVSLCAFPSFVVLGYLGVFCKEVVHTVTLDNMTIESEFDYVEGRVEAFAELRGQTQYEISAIRMIVGGSVSESVALEHGVSVAVLDVYGARELALVEQGLVVRAHLDEGVRNISVTFEEDVAEVRDEVAEFLALTLVNLVRYRVDDCEGQAE